MEYRLKKRGGLFAFFEKDYALLCDGSARCILEFSDWRQADFLIEGISYSIRSDGAGQWVLEQGGSQIAFCERSATGSRLEFSITSGNLAWHFKPNWKKRFVLAHDVLENGDRIGQVTRNIRSWWPELHARFEAAYPVELIAFAVWIIGIQWVGVAGKLTAARAEIGKI